MFAVEHHEGLARWWLLSTRRPIRAVLGWWIVGSWLVAGKVKVRSIVNRGSVVGRILKKDDSFLLHGVHAYSERTMSVALLGGNIEHLQRPIAHYWKIMLSSSFSCCVLVCTTICWSRISLLFFIHQCFLLLFSGRLNSSRTTTHFMKRLWSSISPNHLHHLKQRFYHGFLVLDPRFDCTMKSRNVVVRSKPGQTNKFGKW